MFRPKNQVARQKTSGSRQAPGTAVVVDVPWEGSEDIAERLPAPPFQLHLMATDDHGEAAVWFDDLWWTELITRYADDAIAVVMAPTPGALLHPVVMHQLEMLLRVVPGWRITGYAFVDDLQTLEEWEQAARSPYHELCVVDRLRRPMTAERMEIKPLDEVFSAIRAVQKRYGASRPVLTRLPADAVLPGASTTTGVPSAVPSSPPRRPAGQAGAV